ncbi:hypothetical protein D3Z50_16800 [Clostridiaceae bacterium]|nr:hypothetical protein [Clostridiaceae bacterium]
MKWKRQQGQQNHSSVRLPEKLPGWSAAVCRFRKNDNKTTIQERLYSYGGMQADCICIWGKM